MTNMFMLMIGLTEIDETYTYCKCLLLITELEFKKIKKIKYYDCIPSF